MVIEKLVDSGEPHAEVNVTKRKLSAEKEADLHALRERLLTIIQFVEDTEEDFAVGALLRKNVESAVAKGNLHGLRIMARDFDEATLALAPHEREGLEAILNHRLGIDKEAERAEMSRLAAVAIKRGKVASEKERRRLERYVEMLEAIGGERAELDAVEDLLSNG